MGLVFELAREEGLGFVRGYLQYFVFETTKWHSFL